MYYSLQSGRAIAATLVVLYHLGGAIASEKYFGISGFSTPFSFGDSGVEFFFVLSGFIIYYVHRTDLGKPSSLKEYIFKRVTRIYPVYFIIFLGVYCLALAIPQLRDTVPHDFILIIKSLLLIPLDKNIVGGTGAPVIIVAWTLQFEMMFYLAFALSIFRKSLAPLLLATYFIGFVFSFDELGFPFSFIFSEYILLFIMGIFIAKLVLYDFVHSLNPIYFASIGLIIYTLTALGVVLDFAPPKNIQTFLYGLGCSFIVLAMICYEKRGKVLLKAKFFQLLGAASYVLYLIHYPIISVLCKILTAIGLDNYGVAGALASYLIILATCIIASIIFHLAIEKPIAKSLRRFKPQ